LAIDFINLINVDFTNTFSAGVDCLSTATKWELSLTQEECKKTVEIDNQAKSAITDGLVESS